MNTEKQKTVPLEDVLTELVLAQEKPDAALLDEFTRRFPEYAEALTSYAIELATEAALETDKTSVLPKDAGKEASVLALRAMSRFQNRKFATQTQGRTVSRAAMVNPIASVATKELRAIVAKLEINDVLMMKLRDRRIREDTVPAWFCADLARELSISEDVLRAHLAAPPQIQSATRFKADGKPETATKESFEEAIESSGLTPEQQVALRRR